MDVPEGSYSPGVVALGFALGLVVGVGWKLVSRSAARRYLIVVALGSVWLVGLSLVHVSHTPPRLSTHASIGIREPITVHRDVFANLSSLREPPIPLSSVPVSEARIDAEEQEVKNIAWLFSNCYPAQACAHPLKGVAMPSFSQVQRQIPAEPLPRDWSQRLVERQPKIVEQLDRIAANGSIFDSDQLLHRQRTSYAGFKWSSPAHVRTCETDIRRSFESQLSTLLDSWWTEAHGSRSVPCIFTIVDMSYVDMLDEFYTMLSRHGMTKRFFYVSLDETTTRAACAAGYPVLYLAPSPGQSTRARVYSAKYGVAISLIEANIDFLFLEMDVWILRNLLDLYAEGDEHLVMALHQDNPFTINIGVYFARACVETKLVFSTLLSYLSRYPETFDQGLFNCLVKAHSGIGFLKGRNNCEYDGINVNDTEVQNLHADLMGKIRMRFLAPNTLVSHDIPQVMPETAAVHILTNRPLTSSHGKKVVAKVGQEAFHALMSCF